MTLRFHVVLFATLAFAASASAAPISMNPGSVSIGTVFGLGNDFTITFDGGDTVDNVLDFTAYGGGSGGILPSTALAAIVFDGTDILAVGDTAGGFLNPDNVVRGLSLPGTGVAVALLIDAGAPNAESFWIELAGSPTTATFYSLNLSNPGEIGGLKDIFENFIDSQTVVFNHKGGSAPVPEPSAALVFGLGLLITRGAVRRRRNS